MYQFVPTVMQNVQLNLHFSWKAGILEFVYLRSYIESFENAHFNMLTSNFYFSDIIDSSLGENESNCLKSIYIFSGLFLKR